MPKRKDSVSSDEELEDESSDAPISLKAPLRKVGLWTIAGLK